MIEGEGLGFNIAQMIRDVIKKLEEKGLKTKVKITITNKATGTELLEAIIQYGGSAVLLYLLIEFIKWYLMMRNVRLL